LAGVHFTLIVVDRTSLFTPGPTVSFASDAVQAATPSHSYSNWNSLRSVRLLLDWEPSRRHCGHLAGCGCNRRQNGLGRRETPRSWRCSRRRSISIVARLMSEPKALAYLGGRGFSREVLDRFHVGYSAGDELVPYLIWRKLSVASARRVGLLGADGSEHLAGRIVFAEIRQGQPVWFIGRQLEPEPTGPKYLGLPGRKPLLGWESANRDLRGVCVVEGPLDGLALRHWGVPGLTLCGTRLHPETLELLNRWNRLYLMLDNDTAGHDATEQLVMAFGDRAIPVKLPSCANDPADLAPLADGEALFRAALRDAIDHRQAASR
jgi:DNA primase